MCQNVDTYINICLQHASYITQWSSSFPSPFATNLSYPFHISLNPQFPTQFSSHILSNVFDNSSRIAALFQNRPLNSCLPCHILNMYNRIVPKPPTLHLFLNNLAVVTWSVSTPCKLKNHKSQWDKSKIQLTAYNSVQFSRCLTLILLTWRIGWANNNARK